MGMGDHGGEDGRRRLADGTMDRGDDHVAALPAEAGWNRVDLPTAAVGFGQAGADALRDDLRVGIIAHADTRRRLAGIDLMIHGMREGKGLLDPDMPVDEMRLRMGETTAEEVLCVRAAIRWANSVAVRSLTDERGRDLDEIACIDPNELGLR